MDAQDENPYEPKYKDIQPKRLKIYSFVVSSAAAHDEKSD
jgi:hypothetical protein